jgi:hypothetical protein
VAARLSPECPIAVAIGLTTLLTGGTRPPNDSMIDKRLPRPGKFAQRPIPGLNRAGDEHIFQFVRVFPLSEWHRSSNVIASRSIRHC